MELKKNSLVRIKSKFNLSDFSSSSINYSKKDADFHVLQERVGTNNSIETLSYTNNFNVGQLLPENFGIIFPVNISYNSNKNTPKFLPGTDIRLGNSAPDSVLVQSSVVNVSGRISKKIKSEKALLKYTIDNLSLDLAFRSTKIRYNNEISRPKKYKFQY